MTTDVLNEQMYFEHMDNGLDVIIIPKKGYRKKYATYATHFGSINYKFKVPGKDDITIVPDGVAHFLEHKLFEEEDGVNALDKLSKLGANANAYTSFNHTAYLFECTNNFEECLDALISFVQKPFFTHENVEKEKGIIGQEIKMYDDDPEWQLFFEFIKLMYPSHAITKDIAGTVESISNIDVEILNNCYNTFYDPSNMMICIVGDVDVEETMSILREKTRKSILSNKIDRFFDVENQTVSNQKKIERNMDVSIPMFLFGFKDDTEKIIDAGYNSDTNYLLKKHVSMEIILEMLLGDSSELYQKLYNEGFLLKEFGYDYTFEEDYAYASISGESKFPEKVVEEVCMEIKKIKEHGIDKNKFERIKKMLYGDYVQNFDDVSKIASMFSSDYFKGINSFDYVDAYKNIDIDFVSQILNSNFNKDSMVVSIIKPLEDK